jgi:hypothetical protein
MGKIQDNQTFTGKSPGDVYQAILKAAPQAGLQIWKRRDIAWLVMVRGGKGDQAIDGNISARPVAQATVSLSSENVDDAALHALAQNIFSAITRILG